MNAGSSVRSNNGQYTLAMQTDGNLVLYRINHAVWSTNTAGSGSVRMVFQSDGNLVLYTPAWGATWNSRTAGYPSSTLAVQDDGNLVIYSSLKASIWNSGSANPAAKPFVNHIVQGNDASTRIIHPAFPTEDVVVADYDAAADLEFGADKTGVVDATPAIQRALDKCKANGGGTVWLPVGKYLITRTITIPAFCVLRGDWCDPDLAVPGSGAYGTVILANVPSGANGPSVFSIGGSAGLMGVTIYYPNQSASAVTAYGYAVSIPAVLQQDYMMSSVVNVTLLNAYAGVGVSPSNTTHEMTRIKNLKGTALNVGLFTTNSADTDVYENITFDNKYWAAAGSAFGAPARSTLDAYTHVNGTGFILGDLEWAQFAKVAASHYRVGIHCVAGVRTHLSASFVEASITACGTGVATDPGALDNRWGICFVGGALGGDLYSIANSGTLASGYAMVTQVALAGPTTGSVVMGNGNAQGTPPPAYPLVSPSNVPRTSGPAFIDASASAYGVLRIEPNGDGTIPSPDLDATSGIQRALDDAAAQGGGVVYLPPGWYSVTSHLTVPANVELRGASSAPARDQTLLSMGTVLFGWEGANSPSAGADQALVTLAGASSGVCGLRVFYAGNDPDFGVTTYPVSIRGKGASVYIRNVCVVNAAWGIDLSSFANPQHHVEGVSGWAAFSMIKAGNGVGNIRTLGTNGTHVSRTGFGIQGWPALPDSSNSIGKGNLVLIEVTTGAGPAGEVLTNMFAYGPLFGVYNEHPGTAVFNLGTDGLGPNGYCVVATQPVTVLNILKNDTGLGPTYGYPPYGSISYYNYSYIH